MIAILLINLGTPSSLTKRGIRRYLTQFLTDPRVLTLPFFLRQFLVRAVIVPKRWKESLANYRAIWRKEGSPLLFWSLKAKEALEKELGDNFILKVAMRYQEPSIEKALKSLENVPLERLIIFPLFPQHANATTGSILEAVMRQLIRWRQLPEVAFIPSFFTHPTMIRAITEEITPLLATHDHLLFSFHGLPKKDLACQECKGKNCFCYLGQCLQTAEAIVAQLPPMESTVAFQSRLGKAVWIQPYADETIVRLAQEGVKNLLVCCPSFVADCVETLEEVARGYEKLFKEKGGQRLTLVPSLNTHPLWIQAMKELIYLHCL